MTINRLHKILSALIADGQGRRGVCIDKRTFRHPLEEDGAVILDVKKAETAHHGIVDDDGGTKLLYDGREAGRVSLVLSGDYEEVEIAP